MMDAVSKFAIFGVPMQDTTCPHCGKILRQIRYESDTITVYTPKYEDCKCPGAAADREAQARENAQRAREEAEWKHKDTVRKLLDASGIEERYLGKTFENFDVDMLNRTAFKGALKYANRFSDYLDRGMGLYFTGCSGVGKTHLAISIARALIDQEHRVICKTSVSMLADIRSTYDRIGQRSEYDLLRDYLSADLLVIDDLGKELITDWSLSMLYTVINMRYESSKPLIVTANYTDEELIARFGRTGDRKTGKAIVSRLHEVSYGINVGGADHRGL